MVPPPTAALRRRYPPLLIIIVFTVIFTTLVVSDVQLTPEQETLLISNSRPTDHSFGVSQKYSSGAKKTQHRSFIWNRSTFSSADIVGTLVRGHNSATRLTRSWVPGTPVVGDERSRLQAAYTSLFVKVVTRIGLDLSPSDGSECPFTRGMDEWTPLKYLGMAEAMFQGPLMKPQKARVEEPLGGSCTTDVSREYATAPPTQAEIIGSERTTRLYSLYREEIHATLANAPMTYFSDACLLTYPISILSTCLTAATLAATSSELSHMKKPTFSVFSSIERFRNTVCAHSLPCNVWRSGHWEVLPALDTTSLPTTNTGHWEAQSELSAVAHESARGAVLGSTNSSAVNVASAFASIFAATVGPSNPDSGRDIRRMRERRSTLFPWKSITLTHPRFRALQVGDDTIEFNASRGLFTAQSGADGSIKPLDLPPNEFFRRILKVSRSVEVVDGEGVSQRFPSLITFDGDSLYRGLFYSTIQRLREHGLGSTTTYPLDANLYDVIPPVPSTDTHNEAVYFMYPTPTGIVDVLAERWKRQNGEGTDPLPTSQAISNFRQQRRKCAEELGALARKDPVGTQQLVLKFLSSTMIEMPTSGTKEKGIRKAAVYAYHVLLGYESASEVILYAHIICGARKGSAFPPSFNCPVIIIHLAFTGLQQNIHRSTWPPESMAKRRAIYGTLAPNKQQRQRTQISLYDVTRIGLRVHGVGVWPNGFDHSIINAAALSSADVPDPPIIINRLTTTHSRCCHRESCAQTRMREGPCNSSMPASTPSSIKGLCVLQPPSLPGSSLRKSWDAVPDDFLRYEYIATQLKTDPNATRRGVPTLRLEFKKNMQTITEENFQFDTLGRVLMLLWEGAVVANATNTLLEDWCKSKDDGPQNPLFQSVGKTLLRLLAPICGAPNRYTEAVRTTLAGRSNTVFLDALLLRSLLPFGSTDLNHYDCSTHLIAHDRLQIVHETLQFLQALPSIFSFPNSSLHSLRSTSQPMCVTPSIDAAGLAGLLYSTFPDHFALPDDIRALQRAMPTFWEGSMYVGVPTSGTDDSCRSTLQRSELSLMFGSLSPGSP